VRHGVRMGQTRVLRASVVVRGSARQDVLHFERSVPSTERTIITLRRIIITGTPIPVSKAARDVRSTYGNRYTNQYEDYYGTGL
jgi:hypothetical protein